MTLMKYLKNSTWSILSKQKKNLYIYKWFSYVCIHFSFQIVLKENFIVIREDNGRNWKKSNINIHQTWPNLQLELISRVNQLKLFISLIFILSETFQWPHSFLFYFFLVNFNLKSKLKYLLEFCSSWSSMACAKYSNCKINLIDF